MSQTQELKRRDLIKKYKTEARRLVKERRATMKVNRKLTKAEKSSVKVAYVAKMKTWKQDIKASVKKERVAKRKGLRTYKRILRRPIVLSVWALVIVSFVGLIGNWYYNSTRPMSLEAQLTADVSKAIAEEVMSESIVLLKNEGDLLPLGDQAINVFGSGSVKPVFGGGGAGAVNSTKVDDLYMAFDSEGITYNDTLHNLYGNYVYKNKPVTTDFIKPGKGLLDILLPNIMGMISSTPSEMPAEYLTDDILSEAVSFSDVAVYVISRYGTETIDLTVEELQISETELQIVELLNSHFAHVVVLLNTCNAMELGWVEDFDHVEAVLWVGAPGQYGTYAIAKTLTGEYNPSGRLVDTYAYDLTTNPAVLNAGDFQYLDESGAETGRYFTNYLEGIYMGYRYYETFITEESEYLSTVQYPFGYGLSYTTFNWETLSHTFNQDTITLEVKVTNTGSVSGKDVVEVYFSAPYFPASGIEKSSIELAAFAKTDLLSPGENQTLTLSFSTRELSSYDEFVNQAWVLEAGDYEIILSRNVHSPESTLSYTAPTTIIYDTDEVTGTEIQNLFENADGGLTYLSRSNPIETAPTSPSGDDFLIPASVLDSEVYEHVISNEAIPLQNQDHSILLEDLVGLDYSDPLWDDFLDQFTAEEMIQLTQNAGFWSLAIERLGVPETKMVDGPACIRSFLGSWSTVAFPISTNVASTWNQDLAEAMGEAMGYEAQAYGISAVYAPSMNMHRSPLGGRNFEYYSEDPLISGKIAAAYTRGMQSTGRVVTMKHFAGNEQEKNRGANGLYVWSTEQALRELYFKPFEIAVKEGHAHGAMSAFNRIGPDWAGGSHALLTDLLRTEWGFEGYVITDAAISSSGGYFSGIEALDAGNDMMLAFLFPNKNNQFVKEVRAALEVDEAGTLIALRNATHNICYYVTQTGEMQ